LNQGKKEQYKNRKLLAKQKRFRLRYVGQALLQLQALHTQNVIEPILFYQLVKLVAIHKKLLLFSPAGY